MTQKYQVKVSMKQAAIVETGIVLKQGDFGMQIEIEVLDFDATGTTPQIVFRKAMGAVESTTISVSNNKYTYTFVGTELDTPGKCFCDLKLKNSTTQRISTASFMFRVIADTMDGLNEQASSYSDTIAQIVGGFDDDISALSDRINEANGAVLKGYKELEDGENPNAYFDGTQVRSAVTHGYAYTHITDMEGLLSIEFTKTAQTAAVVYVANSQGVFTGYGGYAGHYDVDLREATEMYINFFHTGMDGYFILHQVQGIDPAILTSINTDIINLQKSEADTNQAILKGYKELEDGENPNAYFDGTQVRSAVTHGYAYTHITDMEGLLSIEFTKTAQTAAVVYVANSQGVFTGYGEYAGHYDVDLREATEMYINFFHIGMQGNFILHQVQGIDPSIIEVVAGLQSRATVDETRITKIESERKNSTNLYDPNAATEGKRIYSNGDIGNATDYEVSALIPTNGQTSFYCNAKVCHFASYNASGAYIADSYGLYTTTTGTQNTVTAATGAPYIRIAPYTGWDENVNDGRDYFYLCKMSDSHIAMEYKQFTLPNLLDKYNKGGQPGYNFFTVTVDNSDVSNGTSTSQSQSNTNNIEVNAVIRLPIDYDPYGKPIPCVMICHGAGYGVATDEWGYYDSSGEYGDQSNFKRLQQAFIDQGFAIMDINGSENTTPFYSWGCKRATDAYRRLYEYCVANFNIREKIGIYGFSMGGIVSLNFTFQNREIVSRLALGCPTVSLYGIYKYAKGFRKAIAQAYNFQGTAPTWSDVYTQAEDDYYQDNIALTYGQDPFARAFTIGDDTYLHGLPPVRIWYGEADDTVDFNGVEDFIEAGINAGERMSIRIVEGQGHRVCYGGIPVVNEEIASWIARALKA